MKILECTQVVLGHAFPELCFRGLLRQIKIAAIGSWSGRLENAECLENFEAGLQIALRDSAPELLLVPLRQVKIVATGSWFGSLEKFGVFRESWAYPPGDRWRIRFQRFVQVPLCQVEIVVTGS